MQIFEVAGDRFLLRMSLGEELMASMREFIDDRNIGAAVIRGLGASQKATLAYYLMDEQRYDPIPVEGFTEVVSLIGNASWTADDQPLVHIHAGLGRPDGSMVGGHVLELVTGATMEIDLEVLPGRLSRKLDEQIGLPLLDRYQCSGITGT